MSEVTAVPLRPIAPGSLAKLWAGLALLAVVGIGAAYAGTEQQVRRAMPPAEYLARNARKSDVKQTPSGLQYEVLRDGTGAHPTAQDMVKVDYEGKLVDGEVFDASARHDGPATLPVGQMIPGFSEALQLMPKGAKYRFWIPPQLGYGPQAMPDPRTGKILIPADSVLVFDIDLLDIMTPGAMGAGLGGLGAMGGSPHGDMGAAPQGDVGMGGH